MDKIQNILVRGPNWIGDHVMALPFYRALRRKYPKAKIDLIIDHIPGGLLLEENLFREIFCLQKKERKLIGLLKTVLKFKNKKWDLGINLPDSFSSKVLFFGLKIKKRIFHTNWLGVHSQKHKSQLYLDLLKEPYLEEPFFKNEKREPIILVAPEASITLREWPYFKNLVKALKIKYPAFQIKIIGNKNFKDWNLSGVENLIGKTTLNEVVELCKRASLFIGNDSGLSHIAATLGGAPTLVIFGPGNPKYIQPLGSCVKGVRLKNLLCSPCESKKCEGRYGYQVCLKDLSVEEVINTGDSLLN